MSKLTSVILSSGFVLSLVGCAHVQEESFYVTKASLQESQRHLELAKEFVSNQTRLDYESKEFVVTGHRIRSGQGTVFAFRSYAPGPLFSVDQAGFLKITVYLPANAFNEGAEFRIPDSNGALAFYSRSSSNFPGSGGCFGYANSGSIKVTKSSPSEITVRANLHFRLSGPLGTALSDCHDKTVEGTYAARQIQVQDLTPWEGVAGKHIYDETIAP